MRRVVEIRKADRIEKGMFILAPQSGMGVLLAHEVTGSEPVDGGKFVEIATEDGLRHLVGKAQQVVVVF